MLHTTTILLHTISSLKKHLVPDLTVADAPLLQIPRTFSTTPPLEKFDPTVRYVSIPWTQPTFKPPFTSRKEDVPHHLVELETLFSHTGYIHHWHYRRPGAEQTSLLLSDPEGSLALWGTLVGPILASVPERTLPASSTRQSLLQKLDAAGISQEMLKQTAAEYLTTCADHAISPWFFSVQASSPTDWYGELFKGKKPYEWILRECSIFNVVMAFLGQKTPETRLSTSDSDPAADERDRILEGRLPGDWEDIGAKEMEAANIEFIQQGLRIEITGQMERDEDLEEIHSSLIPMEEWEILGSLDYFFKHTEGPLEQYQRPGSKYQACLDLPDEIRAREMWGEITKHLIRAWPDTMPYVTNHEKLKRLRSLGEAGVSSSMVYINLPRYKSLCDRAGLCPWNFGLEVPTLSRWTRYYPRPSKTTSRTYLWMLNENRVFRVIWHLLAKGPLLVSIKTDTPLTLQHKVRGWVHSATQGPEALSTEDKSYFTQSNARALQKFIERLELSIEINTFYRFKVRVVARPSEGGKHSTSFKGPALVPEATYLGDPDIYWYKGMRRLYTLVPDLLSECATKRLSTCSWSGPVELQFFLEVANLEGADLSDPTVSARFNRSTSRRIRGLPLVQARAGAEGLPPKTFYDPAYHAEYVSNISDDEQYVTNYVDIVDAGETYNNMSDETWDDYDYDQD